MSGAGAMRDREDGAGRASMARAPGGALCGEAPEPATEPAATGGVAALTLFRFATPARRLWVFAQMSLSRRPLARAPGVRFAKLLGTGRGEGFTPRPNWSVYGMLTTWESLDAARAATRGAAPFSDWRARAAESWTVYLAPISARGKWDGRAPFAPSSAAAGAAEGAPIAALTRATIRPRRAARFWAREPAISARIGADPNVRFKIGLGEMPGLRQITFSIWPDAAAMDAFARKGGPHAEAIRAVREGDWFAEELYARFAVLGADGAWGGADPLDAPPAPPTRQTET